MGTELYQKYQMRIRTGDLIEWAADTALGKAIRFFTKKIVNHTSVSMLLNVTGDDEIRRYIGEALGNGFHLNYLSSSLKNYKGSVYWSALKTNYDDKRIVIAKEAFKLEGKPYDFMSLIRNAAGPVKMDSKDVFCSEAFHIALVKAGLLPDTFNNGMALRPGEFGKTGLFEYPIKIY